MKIRDCCADCGKQYGGEDWVDVLVSNELWAIIGPDGDSGAGILCPNCIARRLREITDSDIWLTTTCRPRLRTHDELKRDTK